MTIPQRNWLSSLSSFALLFKEYFEGKIKKKERHYPTKGETRYRKRRATWVVNKLFHSVLHNFHCSPRLARICVCAPATGLSFPIFIFNLYKNIRCWSFASVKLLLICIWFICEFLFHIFYKCITYRVIFSLILFKWEIYKWNITCKRFY